MDGFAVDSGVIVRGGSEWGCREVSLSAGAGVDLGGPFPWTDSAAYREGEKVR